MWWPLSLTPMLGDRSVLWLPVRLAEWMTSGANLASAACTHTHTYSSHKSLLLHLLSFSCHALRLTSKFSIPASGKPFMQMVAEGWGLSSPESHEQLSYWDLKWVPGSCEHWSRICSEQSLGDEGKRPLFSSSWGSSWNEPQRVFFAGRFWLISWPHS